MAIVFTLGGIVVGVVALEGRSTHPRCAPVGPCCKTVGQFKTCLFEQYCINPELAKTFVPHWTCDYEIGFCVALFGMGFLLFVASCPLCCCLELRCCCSDYAKVDTELLPARTPDQTEETITDNEGDVSTQ